MIIGTLAIVGRPNVGKSAVFNRLLGERKAIVADTPGVTRDRLYGKAEWLTKEFSIIDTGGIQLADAPFQVEIHAQVEIALAEADAVLLVVDGQSGMTNDDQYIAGLLQKSQKPVILAVNKIDDSMFLADKYEFYALGLGEPLAISATHGIGFGDLLDLIVASFPLKQVNQQPEALAFAVIGQPNVGKSSLVNALLNQKRVIVSDIPGTTRDAVDSLFTYEEKDYLIIDTAGIRKSGRIYENVEKYAVLRALGAIERSNVVLFVLDAEHGIREQDKHVAGYAHEAGKPIIIIYNKWDISVENEQTQTDITDEIRQQLAYLVYAPIIFVSALTKKRIHLIIPMIETVYQNSLKRIDTSIVNEVILDAQRLNPPKTSDGKQLRIYYSSQVAVEPPTFVIFVNNALLMHFSYKRYLENRLREAFDFLGTPIHLIIRNRER